MVNNLDKMVLKWFLANCWIRYLRPVNCVNYGRSQHRCCSFGSRGQLPACHLKIDAAYAIARTRMLAIRKRNVSFGNSKTDQRSAACAQKSAPQCCALLRWWWLLFHGNKLPVISSESRFLTSSLSLLGRSTSSPCALAPGWSSLALRARTHVCRKTTFSSLYRSPAWILSAERNARRVCLCTRADKGLWCVSMRVMRMTANQVRFAMELSTANLGLPPAQVFAHAYA